MEEEGPPELFYCTCEFCLKNKKGTGASAKGHCRAENRFKTHMANVFDLIKGSPSVILIVGKEQARFSCHKTLLSFYSAFFDKALYGTFKEAYSNEIVLPEESEQEVSKFVTWLYTGALDCGNDFPACASWVLGDKLGAPEFTNEAMYNIGEYYGIEVLDAAIAKYVYYNTIPGSKLRNFVSDLIKCEGPFAADTTEEWDRDTREIFHAEWISLLGEGGDIVTDNVKSGFRTYVTRKSPPWANKSIGKYLVPEAAAADPEAAKNWHKEKMEAEAEHQKDWEKCRAAEENNLKRAWDAMSSTDLASVDDGDTPSRSRRAGTAPL